MRANRRRDTGPELALRSALHALGLRFRKDHLVRLDGRRPVRVDVAFTRLRVAVFVDGCFWHGCPDHGVVPKANRTYWEPKLARNAQRDREIDSALSEQGWKVIHLWEHVTTKEAAVIVVEAVEERRLLLDSPEDQC
jgi:DNA mismatch endonuclease (patch repair protein)